MSTGDPGTAAVTHSIPAADALAAGLMRDYPLAGDINCRLFMSGVNDVYAVAVGPDRYVLKVYRRGWRTPGEVRYEIDLLAHHAEGGVGVALPIARRDGELLSLLNAPEGERPAVLFQHAPGRQPTWPFY